MPKMKTRKCAAKRIKQTGTGKFVAIEPERVIFLRKRMQNANVVYVRVLKVSKTERKRIQAALPYGL